MEHKQKASSGDQGSSDSDFLVDGGNTDDRKSMAEQAAAEAREKAVLRREMISKGLKDLVREHRKGLENMYGTTEDQLNKSLEEPIKRAEQMAGRLIEEMGCSAMVANDLTVLTLYDVAILIGMC